MFHKLLLVSLGVAAAACLVLPAWGHTLSNGPGRAPPANPLHLANGPVPRHVGLPSPGWAYPARTTVVHEDDNPLPEAAAERGDELRPHAPRFSAPRFSAPRYSAPRYSAPRASSYRPSVRSYSSYRPRLSAPRASTYRPGTSSAYSRYGTYSRTARMTSPVSSVGPISTATSRTGFSFWSPTSGGGEGARGYEPPSWLPNKPPPGIDPSRWRLPTTGPTSMTGGSGSSPLPPAVSVPTLPPVTRVPISLPALPPTISVTPTTPRTPTVSIPSRPTTLGTPGRISGRTPPWVGRVGTGVRDGAIAVGRGLLRGILGGGMSGRSPGEGGSGPSSSAGTVGDEGPANTPYDPNHPENTPPPTATPAPNTPPATSTTPPGNDTIPPPETGPTTTPREFEVIEDPNGGCRVVQPAETAGAYLTAWSAATTKGESSPTRRGTAPPPK